MTSVLTLHEAATELGVHYMTAYRYVRLGLLEATKQGGVWQVTSGAVERFRHGSATAPVQRGQWPDHPAPWVDRLEARLIAGDERGSWGVVEAALASGADLRHVYLDVVSPAMVSIGDRWSAGELDVAVEHRASGIVMRIIGRLGHRFGRRGRSRGAVVVGAPSGERHSLPTAILSDLLRLRGWDVSDLGADVPSASFVHAVHEAPDVVAVGFSVTDPAHIGAAAEASVAVEAACPGVLRIVGGRAVDGDATAGREVAAAYARDDEEMHALLVGEVRRRNEVTARSG